ncbi:hypothetical protein TWF696_002859 [Orbilia brochopaga]|uniref:JmjC domain-containing protein n=1 Tax=Orbilia brochopaga TaxID=3140254 RepID=A0AAV9U4G3_9PEZI
MSILRRIHPMTFTPKTIDTYNASTARSFARRRYATPLQDARPAKFVDRFFVPHIPAFNNSFIPDTFHLDFRKHHAQPQPLKNELVTVEFPVSDGSFNQEAVKWDDFLSLLVAPTSSATQVYLAQCPPPKALADDLPPPFAPLGFTIRPPQRSTSDNNNTDKDNNTTDEDTAPPIDIYSSSLWLSRAEYRTNTPLHRDPNDNLFIQLAGTKLIRLLPPDVGDALFAALTASGYVSSADGRGRIRDNLFDSREIEALDAVTWSNDTHDALMVLSDPKWPSALSADGVFGLHGVQSQLCEAVVERGEGVYIPRGWWHAVRSVPPPVERIRERLETLGVVDAGIPVTASMNWWFR